MVEALEVLQTGHHTHGERAAQPGSSRSSGEGRSAAEFWSAIRVVVALLQVMGSAPAVLLAQSPWERAAGNLQATFTGPLARSLALVAIVIGGLMFMFGESGAKRQISGIVFGGGLALFATQFLAWLF